MKVIKVIGPDLLRHEHIQNIATSYISSGFFVIAFISNNNKYTFVLINQGQYLAPTPPCFDYANNLFETANFIEKETINLSMQEKPQVVSRITFTVCHYAHASSNMPPQIKAALHRDLCYLLSELSFNDFIPDISLQPISNNNSNSHACSYKLKLRGSEYNNEVYIKNCKLEAFLSNNLFKFKKYPELGSLWVEFIIDDILEFATTLKNVVLSPPSLESSRMLTMFDMKGIDEYMKVIKSSEEYIDPAIVNKLPHHPI